MTINPTKIKLFGKTQTLFQVINSKGEVVQVLETKAEAESWIAERGAA